MEERYKCRVIVDLMLDRINENSNKKEILLLLRQNTGHFDNCYDLPGGHLEPNEDLFDAMIREANEEIGIELERKDLEIIHIMHRFEKGALKFVFRAKKYKGKITNKEEDECKEIKWVEIDNLPENIIPKIKTEIQNIEKGIYYEKNND